MDVIDRNVEWTGIARREVTALMAQYERLLFEKRRDVSQAKLDAFLRRPLVDEPHPSRS